MLKWKNSLKLFLTLISLHPLLHAGQEDWPQWGGSDNRNMISNAKNLPDDFELGKAIRNQSNDYVVDLSTTRNVKWAARLGSQTYGNPTVSSGKVFVGTNDAYLDDPRFSKTRGGMVLCFSEADGQLLWRLVIPRFQTSDKSFNFDDGSYGVCSSPTVLGNRVYLVSNRCEVLCLDTEGMANGNDGPFQDEAAYMSDGKNPDTELGHMDADIIWRYDMLKEIPVWPQDASNCSVLLYRDGVIVCTSNGVDRSHTRVPFPDSPSLIVLDKNTGRLVARDDEKVAHRLFHGHWSNPSLGVVNGRPLIFWGGGDGVCYAFEPPADWTDNREISTLKLVWSCDCNPPEYKKIPYQKSHTSFNSEKWGQGPSEIISTPVFYRDKVYITIGQDPRHGRGDGAITCIDATQQGDITSNGIIWTSKAVNRSLSTPSIQDGLLYILDFSGNLYCFDAETGRQYWTHQTSSPVWSSTLAADGKVYFGNEHRDFWIFKADREKQIIRHLRLPDSMYNTPIVANGAMYLATQRFLYALQTLNTN